MQLWGMLPGSITDEVSLSVTLVMAILVALPIKRLRAMTHQIGVGNLRARVKSSFLSRHLPFLGAGDDLDGLAIDFNYMAGRIEALVDAQRLLLRDVSHELRSPLARVNLALELAREESTESARAYLDRIEQETEKLNDLISQLMDLSYMEMMNGLAHPEDIELSLIVLDLLPDLQFEAEANGCRVTAHVAHACRARGDRNLLHHALENVTRNAIRYTPPGGCVSIELSAEDKNGLKQAVMRVSDSGPGVPEKELQAILTPFYRVDKSRHSASGGFGIGLAIADRTIHLHNGELRVSNGGSGGLIVEMVIPAIPVGV
jgi:two-component system sensor histidine kinase CpxA